MIDKTNRDYLRLTYAASSYMEYPENWKERMEIWEDVLGVIEKSTEFANAANKIVGWNINIDNMEPIIPELSVL